MGISSRNLSPQEPIFMQTEWIWDVSILYTGWIGAIVPSPKPTNAQGPILKNRVSPVKIKIEDSYHGAASNDIEISNLKNPSEKNVR